MLTSDLPKQNRRRRRVPLRAIGFAVLGLSLSGCKVDLEVHVQANDLGAGQITVAAELDRDATAALVVVPSSVAPATVAPTTAQTNTVAPATAVPSTVDPVVGPTPTTLGSLALTTDAAPLTTAISTVPPTPLPPLPDGGTRLNLTDLRNSGWSGPGLSPRVDGTSSFALSHPFDSVEEANALLASLSTPDGPLANLRLKRNRSFIGTTVTLRGPGDFSKGLAGFGDAQLASLTNAGAFGVSDQEVLRQTGATSLDQVLTVKVTSNLNDSKSSTLLPIGKATPITASGRSWAWTTIASLLAGLAGLTTFFALRSKHNKALAVEDNQQ